MALSPIARTIKIFFSYATQVSKDEALLKELRKQLKIAKQNKHVEEVYDSDIPAGSTWQQFVNTHISSADIIVLLVSSDFFDSERCPLEMQWASEYCEAGRARVITVLLRPIMSMEQIPGCFGLLPSDGKPITSKPNRDAVLAEVARGIYKVVEEITTSLTRHHRRWSSLWNVPHRQNPFFTGREDILSKAHDYFSTRHTPRTLVQALTGPGGIGKTHLAVEYAYRYKNEYDNIFWIRADSRDLFTSDTCTLADLLDIPEKMRSDETHLFSTVRYWLERHTKWLLILDNLEDFSLIDLLVPHQSSGNILFTTRLQAMGSLARPLPVPQMTLDESTLFLLRRSRIIAEQALHNDASQKDYLEARQIAQEIEGFPLSLDQAGAYIEEKQKSLKDYLALYRQRRPELLGKRGQLHNGHPASMKATLLLTFEKVEQTSPSAMKMLQLLAFLHPDAIPDQLLTEGASALSGPLHKLAINPLELDSAIEILLKFSLVRRQADATTINIHRDVQAILKDRLSLSQQRREATTVVHLMNSIFPTPTFNSWVHCQRYLPQAQICAEHIAAWHLTTSDARQLLCRLGSYYYQRALYKEAEHHLIGALDMYEPLSQSEQSEQKDKATCLNTLALLYSKQGRYQLAELHQQHTLALYKELWGPDHPKTASILNNLGLLYFTWGKSSQAEPLYLQAVQIYEQTPASHPLEIANTLNNLGLLYHKRCEYPLAESFYQRAFDLRTIALPSPHPDIAQSCNNLAAIYQDQGKMQQAIAFLERAVEMRKQTLGPEHPDTALCLHNLAVLYQEQEQYEQAEGIMKQALKIYEQVLGNDHPRTAFCLCSLGLLHRLQGNYQQAEALYLRALTIYERTPNEMLSDFARTLNNLGRLYSIQHRYQQAEPLLQRAITLHEQTSGIEHPDTALSLENLAELFISQNKFQQAEMLYRRSLSIHKKAFGEIHPAVAHSLEKYASLLEQTSRSNEAIALRQDAQKIEAHYRLPKPEVDILPSIGESASD